MSLFLTLFAKLNEQQVKYALVGGLAVVLYGHARMTSDVDLVLHMDRENLLKAIGVLSQLNYAPRLPIDATEFVDPEKRRQWIEQKQMMVFSFYSRANPTMGVDLFVDCPIDPDAIIQRATAKEIGGVMVNICSLDDLILLKRKSGRTIDLDDLKQLESIRARNAKPT